MNTPFKRVSPFKLPFLSTQNAKMTLPQECDDVNTVETWLNSQHPILGNFDLPVEIEGAPKPSGSGNLPRKGWDEDGMNIYSLP
jgi:hypothetical protein